MEEEAVELVHATAGEGFLGGHAEVVAELARRAQGGIGEAREAFGPGALAFVEVVADGADEAVAVARKSGEGVAEEFVRCARAIDIGGHEGADALAVGVLGGLDPARVVEGGAVVHEASAIPGAVSCASDVHT